MTRFAPHAFAALVVLSLAACEKKGPENQPEQVVQNFVDRMNRVHGNPKSARAAYDLLWSEAQRNLAERAKRASALSGRKVAPEEMIAPSHFSLRFEPKQYTANVQGDWAVVTMTGEVPSTQRSTVKCVLEDGSWRVVVELPPLPPIAQRADAGS